MASLEPRIAGDGAIDGWYADSVGLTARLILFNGRQQGQLYLFHRGGWAHLTVAVEPLFFTVCLPRAHSRTHPRWLGVLGACVLARRLAQGIACHELTAHVNEQYVRQQFASVRLRERRVVRSRCDGPRSRQPRSATLLLQRTIAAFLCGHGALIERGGQHGWRAEATVRHILGRRRGLPRFGSCERRSRGAYGGQLWRTTAAAPGVGAKALYTG